MSDFVIDTNVWVIVDKNPRDLTSLAELDCFDRCREWLRQFAAGDDRLVVDMTYKILGEYRKNIRDGGLADDILRTLEAQPRDRIVDVEITLDEEGNAVIPIDFGDPSDRKFIAVALAHEPRPIIVNAGDTDWTKDQQLLLAAGLIVLELCPDFIAELLDRREK